MCPAFRADVARVLELVGPSRCVIWATIWRDGQPDDAFNDVLREAAEANHRAAARRMGRDGARSTPSWLAGDHLHGNETGYRERARAVADGDEIVHARREPDCAMTRIVQLSSRRRCAHLATRRRLSP